ncbi:MAG: hypothetical protein L0Z62_45200 [Gemmataceae bacterium]|nr:hypothetical protein [Gemmataceae bacterium]
MRAEQAGLLQDRHIESLDDLIGLLAGIQSRLFYQPLRPIQAPRRTE